MQVKHRHRDWMPFEEARAFVRSLNLKDSNDWADYCELGNKPPNIPRTPNKVYRDKGWNGLGDWLGTGIAQTRKREYLSFKKARKFARSLQLKRTTDWPKYCKSGLKPDNIPTSPHYIYEKQGWTGMCDWLGIDRNNTSSNDCLPYEQAREYVHTLKFKSNIEWRDWCRHGKHPDNIPPFPNCYYKHNGWKGWKDWLGYSVRHISKYNYLPFDEAREYVRTLKLKNIAEWRDMCHHRKYPENIPASPSFYYKDKGWKGWRDWLGPC